MQEPEKAQFEEAVPEKTEIEEIKQTEKKVEVVEVVEAPFQEVKEDKEEELMLRRNQSTHLGWPAVFSSEFRISLYFKDEEVIVVQPGEKKKADGEDVSIKSPEEQEMPLLVSEMPSGSLEDIPILESGEEEIPEKPEVVEEPEAISMEAELIEKSKKEDISFELSEIEEENIPEEEEKVQLFEEHKVLDAVSRGLAFTPAPRENTEEEIQEQVNISIKEKIEETIDHGSEEAEELEPTEEEKVPLKEAEPKTRAKKKTKSEKKARGTIFNRFKNIFDKDTKKEKKEKIGALSRVAIPRSMQAVQKEEKEEKPRLNFLQKIGILPKPESHEEKRLGILQLKELQKRAVEEEEELRGEAAEPLAAEIPGELEKTGLINKTDDYLEIKIPRRMGVLQKIEFLTDAGVLNRKDISKLSGSIKDIQKEEGQKKKSYSSFLGINVFRIILVALLVISVIGGGSFLWYSAYIRTRLAFFEECKVNIRKISDALVLYAGVHDGKYPAKLEELVPEYMEKLPDCPSAGFASYHLGYQYYNNEKDPTENAYTIFCFGENHGAVTNSANYPLYSSRQGFFERKIDKAEP